MNKTVSILGLTVALSAATLIAAPAATGATTATATRALSCTQTTVSRAGYRRAVSGSVDGGDTLLNATVTRVATGATDISTSNPVLDNGFMSGYYLTHDNWNTWSLGTVQVGSEAEAYYLMLPDTTLPSGTAINSELYINFNNGNDGSNQFLMSCTAS
jgi:hypothetical protein